VTAGEPPLALGWCVNEDGVAADACAPAAGAADSLANVPLRDGSAGSLRFVAGASLIRYNDVVGEVYVRGTLEDTRDGVDDRYHFVAVGSGLERGLGGMQELGEECYGTENSTLVDVATWRFYTRHLEGNLAGIADTPTDGYAQIDFAAVDGEPMQVGAGASGNSRASLNDEGLLLRAVALTADAQDGGDVSDDVEHPELECNATRLEVSETVTREPLCGGGEKITRCWFAEDFRHNSVSACQVVLIEGNTNLTLHGTPGHETAECSDDLP